MACTSVTLSSCPATMTTKDVFKEHNGLRRSESGKDLHKQAILRRSSSENLLCCSVNHIHAETIQPKLKNSRSFGIFPLQISSSIIPNSIRSFLFDPETSRDMDTVEKNVNTGDSSEESDEEEEVKRGNWLERLMEISSHWKNRQKKEDVDGDELCDVEENCDCSSDGDEDGCMVDYNLEKEEGEMKYDRESFSRFLAHVPWSDTKRFSKLAFLCNMAYVIPEIKAMDLRRYYGLRFVTSSLEKKAEAAAVKAKLVKDSTYLPVASLVKSKLEEDEDSKQKKRALPSSVYEIAASAASYVQSRTKVYSSCSSRVYKSEVAAAVAASTMTAVVAAGEEEKQKAAKSLQSLHSSPCEWFVCDDLSTYTCCFVIQVIIPSPSILIWRSHCRRREPNRRSLWEKSIKFEDERIVWIIRRDVQDLHVRELTC